MISDIVEELQAQVQELTDQLEQAEYQAKAWKQVVVNHECEKCKRIRMVDWAEGVKEVERGRCEDSQGR